MLAGIYLFSRFEYYPCYLISLFNHFSFILSMVDFTVADSKPSVLLQFLISSAKSILLNFFSLSFDTKPLPALITSSIGIPAKRHKAVISHMSLYLLCSLSRSSTEHIFVAKRI